MRRSSSPSSRPVGRRSPAARESVLSAAPSMRPGTVIGCCVSLLVSGILLARGFVGVLPSRPVYLVLGGVLAGTALLSLVIDHVSVRVRAERPDHLMVSELDRSRRHGHSLAIAAITCDDAHGLGIVSRLRTTDRAWRTGDELVVLLTETDRAGAVRFLERLGPAIAGDDARVAAFPHDAVTADGLLDALSLPHDTPEAAEAGVVIEDAGPGLTDLGPASGRDPRLAGS